jgi:hypothetical protein
MSSNLGSGISQLGSIILGGGTTTEAPPTPDAPSGGYPSPALYPGPDVYPDGGGASPVVTPPVIASGIATTTSTGLVPTTGGYVAQTSVGALLIDALWPWMTQALAWYCDALGAILSPLHDLVADVGVDGDPDFQPGYGSLLNIDTCADENLPYLAQFAGVTLPVGVGADQARTMIRMEPARKRGSPESIIAAAQRYLTGTQSVKLLESQGPNGPMRGWFVLIVRTEELTSGISWQAEQGSWASATTAWQTGDNATALVEAVALAKPGGAKFVVVQTDGTPWSSETGTWASEPVSWISTG